MQKGGLAFLESLVGQRARLSQKAARNPAGKLGQTNQPNDLAGG